MSLSMRKMKYESMKQTTYKTTAVYSRKRIDATDLGYPVKAHKQTSTGHNVKSFMKGLRDCHLEEGLIKEGKPERFIDTMLTVQDYKFCKYRLNQISIRQ